MKIRAARGEYDHAKLSGYRGSSLRPHVQHYAICRMYKAKNGERTAFGGIPNARRRRNRASAAEAGRKRANML